MRISIIVGLLLPVALVACSGSDSSPPPATPVSVVGSWGGSLDGCMDLCLGSVTMSFDDQGQFAYDYNSGTTTYSGTYERVGAQTFLLTESGGKLGVVVTDASGSHAGLFHTFNSLQFGVLERGASGPAGPYALSDLFGSWAGAGFIPDDSFATVTPFTASATVTASTCGGPACAAYSWSDSTGFVVDSTFPGLDSTYGNGYESTDQAFWFLTPDRNFLGVLFCTVWPSNPSDCRVEGVTKQ